MQEANSVLVVIFCTSCCVIQAEQVLFLYYTCIGNITSALPTLHQAGSDCDAASGFVRSIVLYTVVFFILQCLHTVVFYSVVFYTLKRFIYCSVL